VHTGRPHLFTTMRHLLLCLVLSLAPTAAGAIASITCLRTSIGVECFSATNQPNADTATAAANLECLNAHYESMCSQHILQRIFSNQCVVVVANTMSQPFFGIANTEPDASNQAFNSCTANQAPCHTVQSVCDMSGAQAPLAAPRISAPVIQTKPSAGASAQDLGGWDFLNDPRFWRSMMWAGMLNSILNSVGSGIGLGLGVLIVLFVFLKRATLINFIVHGNLPPKLPYPAEVIEVLFKRSQRKDIIGRAVFVINAQLTMTEDQFTLVRKYWLGRTIAFDSLRRQRQNELARLHLQLAASVQSKPKDKSAVSQLLAALRQLLFMLFWVFRTFFSFLFGFFFIRVNLARLIRGADIESRDLVLLMQAKEAIQNTSIYLKEYLALAETFDGRDEIYNAE
jgi:hypothetical protein